MKQISMRRTLLALGGAGMAMAMVPAPAMAQADARLERIEAQLRALQRQVFPGGDGRYFEPEITPEGAAAGPAAAAVGQPSTSALTDMLARLDAIEAQLARLTAATEVNENALTALEARLPPPVLAIAPTPAAPGTAPATSGATTPATTPAPAPATAAVATPAPATPPPAAAGPSAERLAGVQAITKPASGDAGDDEYVYGFRLWQGGYYPEAQQQLGLFLERYPNHARVTYGRNLLGRALLDAGDPRRAATQFFENYQANKQADRAPDSLLFLAESMIQLDDTRRACIALAEFGEVYPALATGRLQAQYDGLVRRITCN